MGLGYLKVKVELVPQAAPGNEYTVVIRNRDEVLYTLTTDKNGMTDEVPLEAPDKEFSLSPGHEGPAFGAYSVELEPKGNVRQVISGVQIFDGEHSYLPITVYPFNNGQRDGVKLTDIPDTFLDNGLETAAEPSATRRRLDGPARDAAINAFDPSDFVRAADAPVTDPVDPEAPLVHGAEFQGFGFSSPIEANEIRVPTFITVHLGRPTAAARSVRVPFADYIKNVASSEIYPTWEPAALYANIYAQISLALNRVFTVWYRSRGYSFDITNSTAYDQAFVEGRNIFENISRIVDGIFNMFLRVRGRREPLFATYCSGTTATCNGMSQWGSQTLALRGYTPLEIIRHYYRNDTDIVQSNNFTGNLETYPGSPLRLGSTGEPVRIMQVYLNRISGNFYIPPVGFPDGNFGQTTRTSTIEFQKINSLGADGVIGKATWYAITRIYVAVKRLAELESEGERIGVGIAPPTSTISQGARGHDVVLLQFLINFISQVYNAVPFVVENGVFNDATRRAVIDFQREFGLPADGTVGPATWRKLYDTFHAISDNLPPEIKEPPEKYPGTPLSEGSRGAAVQFIQSQLNELAKAYPELPRLFADGIFGPLTRNAVRAFQTKFGLPVTGVINEATWDRIVEEVKSLAGRPSVTYPGTPLRSGSRGSEVRFIQESLVNIAKLFPTIPMISPDGVFGPATDNAVRTFQRLFGLTPDGVVGPITWRNIVRVAEGLSGLSASIYPGTLLREGSSGENVQYIQFRLNRLRRIFGTIPQIAEDGNFGPNTRNAVMAFQRATGLNPDGIVGPNTWNMIVSQYNKSVLG